MTRHSIHWPVLAGAILICCTLPRDAAEALDLPDKPMVIDYGDQEDAPTPPPRARTSPSPSGEAAPGEAAPEQGTDAATPDESRLEEAQEAEPTPIPPVKPAIPAQRVALPWVILATVLILGFVAWLYIRRLHFDNVFDQTYRFPIRPARLRFGATCSGGHGANVTFDTRGPTQKK